MALYNEIEFERGIAEYLHAHGWLYSENGVGYDKELALFPEDVRGWLTDTQPDEFEKFVRPDDSAEIQRKSFARLLSRLVKVLDTPLENGGGTLSVLRGGFKATPAKFRMSQFKPNDAKNPKTVADYAKMRLRVMRQVYYSSSNGNSIDLVFFVNGLPVATMELKTDFTQTVQDAMDQYKTNRLPVDPTTRKSEPLFSFGHRALVHFAVSNAECFMTTHLQGEKTRFLPFNMGNDGHKGNPSNPDGSQTAYVWERVLQRDSWLTILGKFMHLHVEKKVDPITGEKTVFKSLLFPRFHQWEAVNLLADTAAVEGRGHRYLIQHSAGSGKTNSIAWTAHRLNSLHDANGMKIFDAVIVISDRKVLDGQLQEAVQQLNKTDGVFKAITSGSGGSKSKALTAALLGGIQIIGVTLQTFPFALDAIEQNKGLKGKSFAIIADEAHSSQSGDAAKNLKKVLTSGNEAPLAEGEDATEVDEMSLTTEDLLLEEMNKRAESRNLSFFAFTATPKAKTLELFGRKNAAGLPAPFHLYSMQQAIEEGFILDVLKNYTPYKMAFKLAHNGVDYDSDQTIIEKSEAVKELMRWVKLHPHNISQKVAVIVEHFRSNVRHHLAGRAKAMVVTGSRKEAVRYKVAIDKYIADRGYTDLATLVAFSGDVVDSEVSVEKLNEINMNPKLNGREIPKAFNTDEYQIMLVANKFQTGFDQPLLVAMYVDKKLSGITAVQTLSRLNRVTAGKDQTFVIDFVNDPDEILAAFQQYHKEAEMSGVTDPDIVHDLQAKLDKTGIYEESEVEQTAAAWVGKVSHELLRATVEPARSRFKVRYQQARDANDTAGMDALDIFRKDLGSFIRAYDFLSQIIDYQDTDLEKRSIFYKLLARIISSENQDREKLDLSEVVMTHYKLHKQAKADLKLSAEESVALDPMTAAGSATAHEAKKARWAEIIEQMNKFFEGSGLSDADQLSVAESVLNKALENHTLRGQAVANGKADFYSSPKIRTTVEDSVIEAGEQHARGIGWVLSSDKVGEMVELLKKMGLFEKLREEAA
ncbi:type I restriction endonuclease subunit R [Arthrobacter sp. SLBN-122]|uniref:type I restriction endonuclease subunit R n=1 Tax=Arthrobacter sp. SLBN-122 TaxID=2768455 RepID=UPI001154681A|nr:type I restriction endonuclease [Arthrobacter sp. SLBN-122]TQJ33050.1 type I restriction enzyme R subunit [Arthrobacter sp. SLBN-122]